MANFSDWIEGARVRTLPASLAPVILGAGITTAMHQFSLPLTLLAAGVALFFQIGANFANDYSDGIRGTDEFRQGPPRLTGGGKTDPAMVKWAAFVSFAIACGFGLALVALSGFWWLLLTGVAAVLAAWFYTGGKNPYGYIGLGEIFVMLFFGYMATVGTVYTQTGRAPLLAWALATGIGLIACALLMVNNIRDIPTDKQAGKRTLAVRLGQRKARWSYYAMLAAAVVLATLLYLWGYAVAPAFLGLLVWVVALSRPVISGATGHDLLGVLRNTGLFELSYAILVAGALVFTTLFPHWAWGTIGWALLLLVWLVWLAVEAGKLLLRNRHHQHTADSAQLAVDSEASATSE
ncbi:MAG: 1,4-dihydroxy-2-naphthoate polyprenyltransferase [Arcanobacterium sp.]|nr:1,4-dihydroxy-2-naphthoate polyprenyltransferase [Arcanobacterium sp.]